jgi:hypothetical protein
MASQVRRVSLSNTESHRLASALLYERSRQTAASADADTNDLAIHLSDVVL